MKKVLRIGLGGVIMFALLGGLSALPRATHRVTVLLAQQEPVMTLEAFQAVPKKYRQEVVSALTPEAQASLANQYFDWLLAKEDTSPALRAHLQRLKPLTTPERFVQQAEVARRYAEERKKWKAGLRATEPDPSEARLPMLAALLEDYRQLPPEDRAELDFVNYLPEVPAKEPSPIAR